MTPLPMTFDHPSYFINRELSWVEFNKRVLEEAQDAGQPLLERLKFLCITGSNLDEFFEIRVAGLIQLIENHKATAEADGMGPLEVLEKLLFEIRAFVEAQYHLWNEEIKPQMAKHGLHIWSLSRFTKKDLAWAEAYFQREIFPALTPLTIDPCHPFPQLLNKNLSLIVRLHHPETPAKPLYACVQIPKNLPQIISIGSRRESVGWHYVEIVELVRHHIGQLFPGLIVEQAHAFRVTRNGELYIDEEEADNLLETIEEELRKRNRGNAVRLEVQYGCAPEIEKFLLENLQLTERDVYRLQGPLSFAPFFSLAAFERLPQLRDSPFKPILSPLLVSEKNIFSIILQQDVLLHHPYESFSHVVDLLERAAEDPHVMAIKMTLYRTSGDSPIVRALVRAAENNKQVTVIIEIKARFDEANNIQWARALEEAGAHVVYGVVGLKTHAKMLLIARKEKERIRYYTHLGTGNYHPSTARFYTDLGLLTARPEITEDVARLFNILTGGGTFRGIERLLVAPFNFASRFREMIAAEADWARQGKPARIIAKMNALVDAPIIRALYEASCAGVEIDLIVRGVCCLRPGIPGVSERICVRSIVGRFLEHSRIFYFANNGKPQVYLGSADWMPRNFYRRVEVSFPILSEQLQQRIISEILDTYLIDNAKARLLMPDGSYQRLRPPEGQPLRQAQHTFRQLARRQAQRLIASGDEEERQLRLRPIRKIPQHAPPPAVATKSMPSGAEFSNNK